MAGERIVMDLTKVSVAGMDAASEGRARMAKLADGAHQFEAMMLGEMLKGLKFGGSAETAGDGEETAGAAGTIQGYGTEALAKAIANGGGFGLAKQIVRQVTEEDVRRGNGSKV